MSWEMFATLLAIGFAGSVLAGMVGVGGAIVKYPLLLYLPPLLGVGAFSAHQVAGISSVQVMCASLAAAWAYRKSGYLHRRLIGDMGLAMLAGSFVGAYMAHFYSESVVNLVYALLATAATLIMLRPSASDELRGEVDEIAYPRPLAVGLGALVGLFSGVVGSAGAFLLMPILLDILRIPTRVAIASSIAITFVASLGGFVGKWAAHEVMWGPALVLAWASAVGAPLGAKLSRHMDARWLRWLLAALIAATCVRIWMTVLGW
ncbi:MAG: sulfite exporter TauE/SafE family protein [Alicyclobacillus mali]|uniref:sulfite exporter TauE/SafE family protein n=1 Tax=Alicyclobacillus mali (ex Roth et al. 2021) TaxID=1123961 RepID=UPI0023F5645E|nr:sulfite exporter TauE/SafE family protein [Alicyclobacillus mali (ex Roth et al. 2021)]MCL6489069.1 sulfite exporter TauE/SafE family protein [Alicyclobacillus mali (ex Roth et al. 2021)]